MSTLQVVCGAGGFIGGHLVAALLARGLPVRAIDIKPLERWWQQHPDADQRVLDLRGADACAEACGGAARVFNLAADMGGMGFIEANKARCMLSSLINTHLLLASRDAGVARYFFASSACVYPIARQADPDVTALREADVYPAMPEDGYGWEKLFGERMCRHFSEDFGLETRVARFHNIYGPHGSWRGGREKAPAAICRKVAIARRDADPRIEVWGDGSQTRSFTYIDDCIAGTLRLMDSDCAEPLNIGSDQMISINDLVDLIGEIAGITLTRTHKLDAPQGVRGRNSDNTRVRAELGWAPEVGLRRGLQPTFDWIAAQLAM